MEGINRLITMARNRLKKIKETFSKVFAPTKKSSKHIIYPKRPPDKQLPSENNEPKKEVFILPHSRLQKISDLDIFYPVFLDTYKYICKKIGFQKILRPIIRYHLLPENIGKVYAYPLAVGKFVFIEVFVPTLNRKEEEYTFEAIRATWYAYLDALYNGFTKSITFGYCYEYMHVPLEILIKAMVQRSRKFIYWILFWNWVGESFK